MCTVSPVKVFAGTMASGTFLASFDVGGGYRQYMIKLPSMASGGDVRFNVSHDEGVSYRRLYHSPTVASATPAVVNIPSSISNAIVAVPALGQYFQVVNTSAATATSYEFHIICIA